MNYQIEIQAAKVQLYAIYKCMDDEEKKILDIQQNKVDMERVKETLEEKKEHLRKKGAKLEAVMVEIQDTIDKLESELLRHSKNMDELYKMIGEVNDYKEACEKEIESTGMINYTFRLVGGVFGRLKGIFR
jgi:chromosome segregation ATPase